MKINYIHIVAFLLLIAISIGFGFAFDAIATAIERASHPIVETYQSEIQKNAAEFGVPESILWAIVRSESEFESNRVSDSGKIGLMQLTPERYAYVCTELLGEEPKDSGMLYDPATNLRTGAALISALYRRYGVWETVYAAYHAGEEQVDAWLADESLVTPQGRLQNLPDDTQDYMEAVTEAARLYQQLYFDAQA